MDKVFVMPNAASMIIFQLVHCIYHVSAIINFMFDTTDEIHIGGADAYQCSTFICDHFKGQKCCYYPYWHVHPIFGFRPLSLSIFGDAPIDISLSMEWRTDRKYHYPTDLGVTLDRNPSEPTAWVSNCIKLP